MQSRDDVHPAAVRMRAAAPVASFAAPVALLVIAAVTTAVAGDDAAMWLVALAAPALVAVALVVRDVPPIALLVVAGIASAPLWSVAGRIIATRAINSSRGKPVRWSGFWARYARLVAGWIAAATLALVVVRRYR